MLNSLVPKPWMKALHKVFESPEVAHLENFIRDEKSRNQKIYPSEENYFLALQLTPLESVKVVILGQDPYHGEGEAHGLAFSVQAGVKIPPSLRNIFSELKSDVGCEAPASGDLTSWAQQGVLLLNSTLTVSADQPGSHFGQGWEMLTDHLIRHLAEREQPLVFILWGSKAREKKNLIQKPHHLVLEGPHPSPLSSYRGFFGSKPFSKANDFLKRHGVSPISWCLRGATP